MELDNARNAKIEVFKDILSYEEAVTASSSNFPTMLPRPELTAQHSARRLRPDQEIAIGIGRRRGASNSGGFQLIAFVQRRALQDGPIVEKMRERTKDELRIVVSGPISKRNRVRPLKVGCSAAHYRVSSGTLGGFVSLPDAAGIGFLSNNHVLADINAGKYGDAILQPGRYYNGRRPADTCGLLHNFVPINFAPDGINFVDCAVATRAPGMEFDHLEYHTDVPDWMPRPTGKLRASIDLYDDVYKVGHTTGATRGEVNGIEVDNLWVRFSSRFGQESARFDQQITIRGISPEDGTTRVNFSRGGDSGSLIFDAHGNACALLFAGSDTITVANPLEPVLDALDCELYV